MKSPTIPFEIPNVNHGIVVVKGLFHFNDSGIVLEFDERDGFVEYFKSELKEVSVSYSDIESISLIKKIFRTRIEILGRSMKAMNDIPGSKQGKIVLKIARKERQSAEKVISRARVKLSEQKLIDLEGED